ncbi:hypothetical protein Q4566_00325 [Tamlana sp. 2_MG-2023]|uniref:DUF6695 family protein n=1 Tax=unclassified Tamlana TaxID=2614803 RepID=UPI0026E1327C|nr:MULTISPECIES: DUF6695 family protein [unclassified Tamlana]MDO6758627.1 hypothetical protein [Tamlana sp. 2_MG-2023]MDO6789326.1 hypothetical protein [Tamlana sp. 1_MG-2023]
MSRNGIVLILAYPDTIVRGPKEWYAPFMRFVGMGTKNYIRAGHAALVLIDEKTGGLAYYDFGRYIVPEPYGRVRSQETDPELTLPLKAKIVDGSVQNMDDILVYLTTHPKITHGDGKMLASLCHAIDYDKASTFILELQSQKSVRYAAFIKKASNCARFVTDVLIASVTDETIKKNLLKSKRFTPSTVGNVLLGNTEKLVYEVSEQGVISEFNGSQKSENLRCFLDRLKGYKPNLEGNLKPKTVSGLPEEAQWLPGIGSGAWFLLDKTESESDFRFRRVSPYGTVDCDAEFSVDKKDFCFNSDFRFLPFSNCKSFQIEQDGTVFNFNQVVSSEEIYK